MEPYIEEESEFEYRNEDISEVKSRLSNAINKVDGGMDMVESIIYDKSDALPEDIGIRIGDAFDALDRTRDELNGILGELETMGGSE